MKPQNTFLIEPQPSDTTCGPACLHSIYRFWGLDIPLEQVVEEVHSVPDGGTSAVNLALHALDKGFRCTIFTSNLALFDPTWFEPKGRTVVEGIKGEILAKNDPKLKIVLESYLEYLERGGLLFMEDLSFDLIASIVSEKVPLIAGLSCTWLYRCKRELPTGEPDDLAGDSTGHFVVVYGVDKKGRQFAVADPEGDHPLSDEHCYSIGASRLIGAIMLGIVTYDAKLLMITPPNWKTRK